MPLGYQETDRVAGRRKMRHPRKLLSYILITCLLVGCGFHLRGMVDMPKWLDNVAIVVQQGHRDLAPLIKEQLQSYKIYVNPDTTSAQYWLIIEHDDIQQNITSVSSSTTPRQYQLIYNLRFQLTRTNGKVLFPSSQVAVTRQITINSDRILGSTEEEELLKSEMRRDAVMQVINRLSRITPDERELP